MAELAIQRSSAARCGGGGGQRSSWHPGGAPSIGIDLRRAGQVEALGAGHSLCCRRLSHGWPRTGVADVDAGAVDCPRCNWGRDVLLLCRGKCAESAPRNPTRLADGTDARSAAGARARDGRSGAKLCDCGGRTRYGKPLGGVRSDPRRSWLREHRALRGDLHADEAFERMEYERGRYRRRHTSADGVGRCGRLACGARSCAAVCVAVFVAGPSVFLRLSLSLSLSLALSLWSSLTSITHARTASFTLPVTLTPYTRRPSLRFSRSFHTFTRSPTTIAKIMPVAGSR